METRFNLEGIRNAIELSYPVFRDGVVCKFLLAWLDQRIFELGRSLENITADELKWVQGEIAEARKIREFLARANVPQALSELITKLK